MFRVKHGQAEWETLFISYVFQKPELLWSLEDDQLKQNKAPNLHGSHRLDCCKYALSAMKSLRGITMIPRAAEMGLFILSNNLLRKSSPRINAFYCFGVSLGCAGLCTQVLWQQLYSSSFSRNYQGVTLVSNRFNVNYFFHLWSERGYGGYFWSSLTTAQHLYRGEEQLQSHPLRTNPVTS